MDYYTQTSGSSYPAYGPYQGFVPPTTRGPSPGGFRFQPSWVRQETPSPYVLSRAFTHTDGILSGQANGYISRPELSYSHQRYAREIDNLMHQEYRTGRPTNAPLGALIADYNALTHVQYNFGRYDLDDDRMLYVGQCEDFMSPCTEVMKGYDQLSRYPGEDCPPCGQPPMMDDPWGEMFGCEDASYGMPTCPPTQDPYSPYALY